MGVIDSEESYKKYKQYRVNRYRDKTDQIVFPIVMLIFIGVITKLWYLIVALSGIILVLFIIKCFKNYRNKMKQFQKEEKIFVSEKGMEREINKVLKSTDFGYVNKNHQQNNGRSTRLGTDNNQWFYNMKCLQCGHVYFANGTDIWSRKCPKCQGGKE